MSFIKHPQPVKQREQPYRNRAYLNHVRTLPCIISGHRGEDVDPAHIRRLGGGGLSVKPPDNCVLPLKNELHRLQHNIGEKRFWREQITDALLFEALLALAEKQHRLWLNGQD